MEPLNIVIVGGVAGGASCAARARRLSESARITVFERGPHVSFANCGLPYYVGNVIANKESLLMATPQLFQERFRMDVRVRHEVLAVNRQARYVEVRDGNTGACAKVPYDALLLAPGAAPIRPDLPGMDLPGVFTLRNIPDSDNIKQWIDQNKVRHAVIAGAGFIGLEMAENLVHRGIEVTVLEMQKQILPPFDAEMTVALEEHLQDKGVSLILGEALAGAERDASGSLQVQTASGHRLLAGLLLLALGVKPENRLAMDCGLELGARGAIRVNASMRTSDAHIWAVGDAVEVRDIVTGQQVTVPLAGPANRQGRVAADSMLGHASQFRGVQATAACKVFDRMAAMTGASEKTLQRAGIAYEKAYLHTAQHAHYYPGAKPLALKLLFAPQDGRIFGAQAVGEEGAERRIDVIAMAMQKQGTVFDLEEAELCYAPQVGSAKDPVNILGMIAANALRGDAPLAQWNALDLQRDYLLDVRDKEEFQALHAAHSVNIPLAELRENLLRLPRKEKIFVTCAGGQRAHYATRTLRLHGLDARNVSGGIKTYEAYRKKAGA